MAADNEMSKARKRAKIMYIMFVVGVIIFTTITYVVIRPFEGMLL